MSPTRRDFLRAVGAAAIGAAAGVPAGAEDAAAIPARDLGRTGAKVTLLGLGGWHVGKGPDAEAIAMIQRAVDEGVTFLDNAADYHAGRSEERMGKALAAGGRRDRVFLMTKGCDHARTRDGSLRGLEESLRRLGTDRLDLWQLHDITSADDPSRIFARGGAIEAVEDAKKRGLVRFVGFTGHRDPRLFLEMLKHGFAWDACQMPLNPADVHHRSFEREALPAANAAGLAVIGMKSLASGTLATAGVVSPSECIRYAMSLPVATVVCGIDSRETLEQALKVARGFKAMDGAERAALASKVAGVAKGGALEGYKHP